MAECHSMRRGYHYLPKFLLGKPIDLCGERLLRWRLPLGLRRWITQRMVTLALGRPEDYGLPQPDHKLLFKGAWHDPAARLAAVRVIAADLAGLITTVAKKSAA